MEPITLTIGITLAAASVAKAAHEKSVARQKLYADEINRKAQELAEAEISLAEKRRAALKLAAVQTALRVGEQKRQQAEASVRKKQQTQMLIAGALGLTAIGFIAYSVRK